MMKGRRGRKEASRTKASHSQTRLDASAIRGLAVMRKEGMSRDSVNISQMCLDVSASNQMGAPCGMLMSGPPDFTTSNQEQHHPCQPSDTRIARRRLALENSAGGRASKVLEQLRWGGSSVSLTMASCVVAEE